MTQKVYFRATKPALIVGIIVVLVFLLFGIFFFTVLMKEDAVIGMVFMVFWLFIVLLIGGIYVLYASFKVEHISFITRIP